MDKSNCASCGGSDLEVIHNKHPGAGSSNGNYIPIRRFGIFGIKKVKLSRVICVDCGYVTSWVFDKKILQEIKEHRNKKNSEK